MRPSADVIAKQGLLEDGLNFIEKPFSIQTLTEKVRNALEKEAYLSCIPS